LFVGKENKAWFIESVGRYSAQAQTTPKLFDKQLLGGLVSFANKSKI